jgi:hypothetical protein
MNTVSRFRKGLERFRGYVEKAGRNPADIEVALRVLSGPGGKPRASIDGEAEMFTGGDADWVEDINALKELGVAAVDVRLFRRTASDTLDTMRRFREGVLGKVRP